MEIMDIMYRQRFQIKRVKKLLEKNRSDNTLVGHANPEEKSVIRRKILWVGTENNSPKKFSEYLLQILPGPALFSTRKS